jgi:hypothetical protein
MLHELNGLHGAAGRFDVVCKHSSLPMVLHKRTVLGRAYPWKRMRERDGHDTREILMGEIKERVNC